MYKLTTTHAWDAALAAAIDAMVAAVTNESVAQSRHWVSLVTLRQHELNERQSKPHVDAQASAFMFSSILYLFNATSAFGGTLFFAPPPPPDDTPRKFVPAYANCSAYRCLGAVDAQYNRAAVYPAWQVCNSDVCCALFVLLTALTRPSFMQRRCQTTPRCPTTRRSVVSR